MNVDLAPLAIAAINQIVPIVITGVVGIAMNALRPALTRYIGEKNALTLQERVNQVLNAGIGYAVQKGSALVTEHGALTVENKNVLVGYAVKYAVDHAPDLMTEVGGVVEKVLARFDSHPAVQGLAYAVAQPVTARAA